MSPHTLISSLVYDRTVAIYLIISNEQLFDGSNKKKLYFVFYHLLKISLARCIFT